MAEPTEGWSLNSHPKSGRERIHSTRAIRPLWTALWKGLGGVAGWRGSPGRFHLKGAEPPPIRVLTIQVSYSTTAVRAIRAPVPEA